MGLEAVLPGPQNALYVMLLVQNKLRTTVTVRVRIRVKIDSLGYCPAYNLSGYMQVYNISLNSIVTPNLGRLPSTDI